MFLALIRRTDFFLKIRPILAYFLVLSKRFVYDTPSLQGILSLGQKNQKVQNSNLKVAHLLHRVIIIFKIIPQQIGGFYANWTGFENSFRIEIRLLGLQQFTSSRFHFLSIAESSTFEVFHRSCYRCSEEVEGAVREWLPLKVPYAYNGGSFKLLSFGENVCLYCRIILKISDASAD